ncbi:MAG: hypothetical protein IPN66_10565 [Candidatus Competibacteraceae bacterium]|nr:hypothetical protein [Candidatus Competibacteraceae bacterium]MBK8897623.1 hypothetical protein [Candidatus Competibacteraceae bacterium]MBK8963767.1 hypothetical protein [Candidatus Competibacteraceae bacterium]
MMTRLSLVLALLLGCAGAAQAQRYDQAMTAQSWAADVRTVSACGPGGNKKDPP